MDPSPSGRSSPRRSSSYGGLDPSPSHRSRRGSRSPSSKSRFAAKAEERQQQQRKSPSPRASPPRSPNRYSSVRERRNDYDDDDEEEYVDADGMISFSGGRYSVSSSMDDTAPLRPSSRASAAASPTQKDGTIRSASSLLSTPTTASSQHRHQKESTTSTAPASGGSKSSTYLSRKAHRMQRKKRQSAAALGGSGSGEGGSNTSTFLNKLFCTSEDSLPNRDTKGSKIRSGGSHRRDDSSGTATNSLCLTIKKGAAECGMGDGDNDDYEETAAEGCDSSAANDATKGCVTFAITDAVASLRLDREARVRLTIQESMLDAQESVMAAVCGAVSGSSNKCSGDGHVSSPPTHQVSNSIGRSTTGSLASPTTKRLSSPLSSPTKSKSLFKSYSDDNDDEDGNTNNIDSAKKDENGNGDDTAEGDEDVNKDSWEEPSKLDNIAMEEEAKARTERAASSPGRRDSPPSSPRGAGGAGACGASSEFNDEEDKYKPILASAAAAIATAVDYKPPSLPDDGVNSDGDDHGGGDKYAMNDVSENDKKIEVFLHSLSEHDATAFLPNSLVSTLTTTKQEGANSDNNNIGSHTAGASPLPGQSMVSTWVQVQERLAKAVEKVKDEYDQRLDDEKSLEDQKNLVSELQKERDVWQKDFESKLEAEWKVRMNDAIAEARKEWQAQHEQELSRATSECQSLEQALSEKEKSLESERAKLKAKLQQEFQDQLNQQKDQVQLAKRRAAQQESELDVYISKLQQTNGLVQELEGKIQQYESKSMDGQSFAEELRLKEQALTDLREQVSKLEMSKSMEDGTVFEQLQKLETAKSNEEQALQKQLISKDQALQELQEQMSKMEMTMSNVTTSADEEQAAALQEQLKAKDMALQELQEHVNKLESMRSLDETLLQQKLKAKDEALQKLEEQLHKYESSTESCSNAKVEQKIMMPLPEQLVAKDEELQKVAELETLKTKDELHASLQEQLETKEQELKDLQEQEQAAMTESNEKSGFEEQMKDKDEELQKLKDQVTMLETSKITADVVQTALQEKLNKKDEELQAAIHAKDELEREKEMQVCAARKLQDKLQKQQKTLATTTSSQPNSPTIDDASSSPLTISASTSRDRDRPVINMQEELRNLQERLKTQRSGSPTKALSPMRQQKFEQEKQALEESYQCEIQKTRDEYEAQLEDLRSQIKELQDRREEDAHVEQEKLAQAQIEAAKQQVRDQSLHRQVAALEMELAEHLQCDLSHQQQVQALEGSVQAQQELVREKEQQLEQAQAQVAELSKQQEEEETTAELLEQYEKELGIFQREVETLKEQMVEKDKEIEQARQQSHGSPARHASPSSARPSSITPVRARSPSGILPPSSNRKETSIELHEREKEALRQQISVLEGQLTTMNQQHEDALEEIRRKSEQELVDIRKDMEARIEKHMKNERDLKDTLATVDSADKEDLLSRIEQLEAEKKADRGGCLREVQKKEELLSRIAALEKREKELLKEQEIALQDVRANSEAEIQRLRKEIEKEKADSSEKERELQQAISETQSFEKEELLQRIDKLEALLENERNGAVLVKMKVANMERELKAAREAHHKEVTKLRKKSDAEIKHLNEELQELSAIEDAMQITTNERDVLEEEVKSLRAAMEKDQRQHKEEKTLYAEELKTLQKEAAEAMEMAGHEAQDRIKELEKQLEEKEKEKADILSRQGLSAGEEKVLRDELQGLKSQIEHDKNRFADQMMELNKEHSKKCEEMQSQHALVENEHKKRLAALEKAASEKDAIITALGSQLAEAQARTKGVEEERQKLAKELDRTKSEATKLDKDLVKLRGELTKLRDAHESYMEKASAAKEAAAEQAREEMIERAEVQFKQANELYVKLKKQYDICKRKVETLEKELKRQKDLCAKAASTEIHLKTEISKLKASNAKAETDSARKEKEYRREMERLLEAAETFENKNKEGEKKLAAAEALSHHAQKKLSVLQAEKDKLQKELVEVKSVCEELMAMVEGQHHEC